MKCTFCENGNFKSAVKTQYLEIDGAPVFEVPNVNIRECDNCKEQLVDSRTSENVTHKLLEQVFDYYATRADEIPGKIAEWMRKSIELSTKLLASKMRINESSLSHAASRNTRLSTHSGIVLLLLCKDFLEKTKIGEQKIEEMNDLRSIWKPDIPIISIVELVQSQLATSSSSRTKRKHIKGKKIEGVRQSEAAFFKKSYRPILMSAQREKER